MLLRYPGGKSRGAWSNHIVEEISQRYRGGVFGELFFGGGGITLKLLKKGVIKSLLINELDPSLARFWNAVIKQPCRLRSGIRAVNPSVELFLHSKERVLRGVGSSLEALIVNRMSHGGRGVKAGPQGGVNQTGKYKIGCRWNADKLCKDVSTCNRLFKSVNIIGGKCHSGDYAGWLDAADFLYLDPPYWEVGEGLYLHSFNEVEHFRMYHLIRSQTNWILSYNNVVDIRKIYFCYHTEVGSVAGNGGTKEGSELLIIPWEIA
jgi:DNA adenine methylase